MKSQYYYHDRPSYFKPPHFQHYFTLSECAEAVDRHPSHIIRLERQGKIPKPSRVECGQLRVRLYSPEQVKEIKKILSKVKLGRPPKNG
jgi:DNA-binding transcriptional MerR regulator